MNFTICQDQQNIIERVLQVQLDGLRHLIQDMREICRPRQRDIREILPVDLSDTGRTIDLRVVRIAIKSETMLGLVDAKEARHTSKAVNWEAPIVIVDLQDRAHGCDSLLVLVEFTKVVKRVRH